MYVFDGLRDNNVVSIALLWSALKETRKIKV
jgi:hypothetical protein